MTRVTFFIALIVSFALTGCASDGLSPQVEDPQPVQDQISAKDVSSQYLVLFSGKTIPNTFSDDVIAAGGNVFYTHEGAGFAIVSNLTESDAVELQSSNRVKVVQRDAVVELLTPESADVLDVTSKSTNPAGAPFFPIQWNLPAIDAEAAWDADALGSEAVTLAILDTGIDYLHPDLQGRVDLDRSTSFIPADDAIVRTNFPGRDVVTDLNFHGTHVAATTTSNAAVLAGVTAKTTLMGVKVCNRNGNCPLSTVLAGVLYAADNGADVINLSLGGYQQRSDLNRLNGVIARIFNQVKQADVNVVASAGNRGLDLDSEPGLFKTWCDAPHVICVSATGPTTGSLFGPWQEIDAPFFNTNFGRSSIDVAAPGGNSGGRVYAACSQTSLIFTDCQQVETGIGLRGTSFASAHVAGLTALVRAEKGGNAAQTRSTILSTAVDLGQPGTDPFYGKGYINVAAALGLE